MRQRRRPRRCRRAGAADHRRGRATRSPARSSARSTSSWRRAARPRCTASTSPAARRTCPRLAAAIERRSRVPVEVLQPIEQHRRRGQGGQHAAAPHARRAALRRARARDAQGQGEARVIRINLLPQKRERRARRRRPSQRWLLVVLGVGRARDRRPLPRSTSASAKSSTSRTRKNAAARGARSTTSSKLVANHEEIKKQLAVLRAREDAIAKLQAGAHRPDRGAARARAAAHAGQGPDRRPRPARAAAQGQPARGLQPGLGRAPALAHVATSRGDRTVTHRGPRARRRRRLRARAAPQALDLLLRRDSSCPGKKETETEHEARARQLRAAAEGEVLMAAQAPRRARGSTLDRLPPVAKVGVGFALRRRSSARSTSSSSTATLDTRSRRAQAAREARSAASSHAAEASQRPYQKDLDEKTRREQLRARAEEDPARRARDAGVPLGAAGRRHDLRREPHVVEPRRRRSPQEFFAKVPMKLTLAGKFHQVAKFFYGVGQLDRIINIENIQHQDAAEGDDGDEVERQGRVPGDGVPRATPRRAPGRSGEGRANEARRHEAPRRARARRARRVLARRRADAVAAGAGRAGSGAAPAAAPARRAPRRRRRRERRCRAGPTASAPAAARSASSSEDDFAETERSRDPFRELRRASSCQQAQARVDRAARGRSSTGTRSTSSSSSASSRARTRARAARRSRTALGWVVKVGDFVGKPEIVHAGGPDAASTSRSTGASTASATATSCSSARTRRTPRSPPPRASSPSARPRSPRTTRR